MEKTVRPVFFPPSASCFALLSPPPLLGKAPLSADFSQRDTTWRDFRSAFLFFSSASWTNP